MKNISLLSLLFLVLFLNSCSKRDSTVNIDPIPIIANIDTLDCNNKVINNPNLIEGLPLSGVSISIPYKGGDGGAYSGHTLFSTKGDLIATLPDGNLTYGEGVLTWSISGTPLSKGNNCFYLNFDGKICSVCLVVNSSSGGTGSITSLNCNDKTTNGILFAGKAASGVSISVPYKGGNSGAYTNQIISSTGVTGLTATLTAGNFANGDGILTWSISGIPNSQGNPCFALNAGGITCFACLTVKANTLVSNPGNGVTFDGYFYPSFVLGNGQEWMAENLRTTRFADGSIIPNIKDDNQWYNAYNTKAAAWCHYNNDNKYENPYGKLYNWYAIKDTRNICPTGWHIPSDAEWTVFTDYLGGESVSGIKMKSIGKQYWNTFDIGTNESGFSGLPGGVRSSLGSFLNLTFEGSWWSSTEKEQLSGWNRNLIDGWGLTRRFETTKNAGNSVRCIKN